MMKLPLACRVALAGVRSRLHTVLNTRIRLQCILFFPTNYVHTRRLSAVVPASAVPKSDL
jgi:hypothetical protein